MLSFRKISIVAMIVIALCLSGCGKKEATPDTAGKTPAVVALEIMKLANEGKFEEVKKLMSNDLIVKLESKKKTLKDYFDRKTSKQTIKSQKVLVDKPGKIHPWRIEVRAVFENGSSVSVVLVFKLEGGLWLMAG